MHFVVTGKIAFDGNEGLEFNKRVKDHDFTNPFPKHTSLEIIALFDKLAQTDSTSRPTAVKALEWIRDEVEMLKKAPI